MSVFLTPDLKPVYGGTYYPPDDRYYGRPGFKSILASLPEQVSRFALGTMAKGHFSRIVIPVEVEPEQIQELGREDSGGAIAVGVTGPCHGHTTGGPLHETLLRPAGTLVRTALRWLQRAAQVPAAGQFAFPDAVARPRRRFGARRQQGARHVPAHFAHDGERRHLRSRRPREYRARCTKNNSLLRNPITVSLLFIEFFPPSVWQGLRSLLDRRPMARTPLREDAVRSGAASERLHGRLSPEQGRRFGSRRPGHLHLRDERYVGPVRRLLYVKSHCKSARDSRRCIKYVNSAEDADSYPEEGAKEKREGAFYVWTWSEVRDALSADEADVVCHHFDVRPNGNVDPYQVIIAGSRPKFISIHKLGRLAVSLLLYPAEEGGAFFFLRAVSLLSRTADGWQERRRRRRDFLPRWTSAKSRPSCSTCPPFYDCFQPARLACDPGFLIRRCLFVRVFSYLLSRGALYPSLFFASVFYCTTLFIMLAVLFVCIGNL